MKIKMSDINEAKSFKLTCRPNIKENPLLTNSMMKDELLNPIVVVKESEKYVILAGLLRYISAKVLQWQEIEVKIVENIPTIKTDLP